MRTSVSGVNRGVERGPRLDACGRRYSVRRGDHPSPAEATDRTPLGRLMKASAASRALTLVSRAPPNRLDPAALQKSDVQVHVRRPVPSLKDGPSAGVAMFLLALTSL